MNPPAILRRHRALRWLAPVGVVGVAGLAASGLFSSNAASQSLPATSPASLIAQVRTAQTSGFSGTVVSTFALGLPELPSFGSVGDGSSLTSLLTGTHTMQVWYGGADQQRIALLGTTDETDVFRNGRDVWEWSSADRTAVHTRLPAGPAGELSSTLATATPEQLAKRVLAMLDSTTVVRVEYEHDIADRSSYELVLTPRDASTLIGTVRIAVDGATKVPLGVRVYARGAQAPAIDVGFTSVRFGHPSVRNFSFTPPPGAKVGTAQPGEDAPSSRAGSASPHVDATVAPKVTKVRPQVKVVGSGWSRIVVIRPGPTALRGRAVQDLLRQATTVAGTWGSGRLFQTPLLSVLLADDGRVLAGAVEPSALYAAAAAK